MAAGVSQPFDAIDWSAPWLAPWRAQGQPLAQQLQHDTAVHRALQAAAPPGAPVAFVPQSALPEGAAYEQYIWDTRRVPTRDNLHDFFNGLVWLQFPHTKRRLNQLQAQAIAADGVQAVRGPLRDAVTVFDENGALLQAPMPCGMRSGRGTGSACSSTCAPCGPGLGWCCSGTHCSNSWFFRENPWWRTYFMRQ